MSKYSNALFAFITVIWVSCALSGFAGWLTHIVFCLQHGRWGFLIAGAIAFPIGVIHGWGLWFGWFH